MARSPHPERYSARSSPVPSPSRAPHAESPYQRRLRGILHDHRTARLAWSSLVLERGLAIASSLVSLRSDLEAGRSYTPRDLRLDEAQKQHLTACYVARKTSEHENQAAQLANLVLELDGINDRLRTAVRALDDLVLDASRTRGLEYGFATPVWLTWSFSRFADALHERTAPYAEAVHLHRQLAADLCDPSTSPSDCQAALSHWACQPLLPSSRTVADWDDLVAIEVPAPPA